MENMATLNSSDQLACEPLDTLHMKVCGKNGTITLVPALHHGFMEPRNYVFFKSPPIPLNDSEQNELQAEEAEWLESAKYLEEDLHWVLKLPHHRFWSQIVNEVDLHMCLESYLSYAPRHYDMINLKFKEEILLSLKRIHKLIFLIFLRMSTYKESKKHHITPEYFGNLIYDKYIFDMPKLMDICALYGLQNMQLISKMVQNIFSTQPKYLDDLNSTSQAVLEAFSSIEERLQSLHDVKGIPVLQVNGVKSYPESVLPALHDAVNYLTDVSFTLYSFLEVYPSACQIFYQNGATLRIATFYEIAHPTVEKDISKCNKHEEWDRILQDVKRKVTLSKTLLVEIFRSILNYCCIQDLVNSVSTGDNSSAPDSHINQFFDVFTEIALAKSFLQDYNLLHPIEADCVFFNELGIKIDQKKVNYIMCSIHDSEQTSPPAFASSEQHGARPKIKNQENSNPPTFQNAVDLLRGNKSSEKDMNKTQASISACNGFSDAETNTKVKSISECLNISDESFIKRCLEYFNNDVDRVIDAYCTGNIPEQLTTSEEISEKTDKVENGDSSILLARKCIYDGDEFDLFRRDDINMDNVHIGKKNKTPSAYETLSKDSESDFLKEYILSYGSEETDYIERPYKDGPSNHFDPYEDEYDDTYDSEMIGVKEPVPEGMPDADASEDKKIEERTEKAAEVISSRDTSRDFCENPENIRQRQEQRREAKAAARGGNYRTGGPQSDETRNQQHKDRNKAYVGNHNRRKQSDFKKSRGMFS